MTSMRRRAAWAAMFVPVVLVAVAAVARAQRPVQPAQRGGPPNPDTPHILVGTFGSADRQLGIQAADAVRHRLQDEYSAKQLFVVTKHEIDETLKLSGYNPDSVLGASDLMELAKQVRGDEVIDAVARQTPEGGVKIEARLMLKRNQTILVQPLPAATSRNVGDAGREIVRSLGEARKALPAYKTCENDLRAQKYDAALIDGRAALQAYPNSTFGRLCLLTAFTLSKAPGDSVIKVADDILKIDTASTIALGNAAEAYRAKGNSDKFVDYGRRIYRADPSNEALARLIIDELAKLGRHDEALQIVGEMLGPNPGDPQLLRVKWQLQLAAKRYKDAIATGDQLLKADSSQATLDFFNRMAAAAALDSQPQLAATIYERGIQRFPNDADMQLAYAQALAKSGRLPQALAAAQRAVVLNPKIQSGLLYVLSLQVQLNQLDSALVTAPKAVAAGASKEAIGNALLAVVAPAVKKAQESKSRDDWQAALKTTQTVDAIVPTPATKFYIGVAAFSIGADAVQSIQDLNKQLKAAKPAAAKEIMAKACAETKVAEDAFAAAQIAMPAGGAYNKETATQILSGLQQYSDFVAQAKKGFCK